MKAEILKMRDRILDKDYHKGLEIDHCAAELEACFIDGAEAGESPVLRQTKLFQEVCRRQQAIVHRGENIPFTRTIGDMGYSRLGNICADWSTVLQQGLDGRIAVARSSIETFQGDAKKTDFLHATVACLTAISELIERHAKEAVIQGEAQLAEKLFAISHATPSSFHEALLLHNFLRECLWLAGHNHICLGRFDQYMIPFLTADLEAGRICMEDAENLLGEFFLAANRNSHFYFGLQQGDNGQSLMLGGCTPDGACAVNPLTYLCLRVSEQLGVIDPKINLRIDGQTELALLEAAARLTRRGLGFPQYSNDDVVIPGLVKHGYALEDARDYTVAACWEFIIPGKAIDIPNIETVSFPAAVDASMRETFAADESFDDLLTRVRKHLHQQVDTILINAKGFHFKEAPVFSCFLTDALETGCEAEEAVKYRNYGIHGSASSNAVDALVAIKKHVFEEKTVAAHELLAAVDSNWVGAEELRARLIADPAKTGNNDPQSNAMLEFLFEAFADACEAPRKLLRGDVVRPGTGSAMNYVYLADKNLHPLAVGATADGRREGDFFSSSLAPSPGVKVNGPISIFQSYAHIDYIRICNGGPITMELSNLVFHSERDVHKVALLLKAFVDTGCQQLQLNTLNIATLKEAMQYPEKHRNLIVRVWGWSGYFCELDSRYQEQIIQRNMLMAG